MAVLPAVVWQLQFVCSTTADDQAQAACDRVALKDNLEDNHLVIEVCSNYDLSLDMQPLMCTQNTAAGYYNSVVRAPV